MDLIYWSFRYWGQGRPSFFYLGGGGVKWVNLKWGSKMKKILVVPTAPLNSFGRGNPHFNPPSWTSLNGVKGVDTVILASCMYYLISVHENLVQHPSKIYRYIKRRNFLKENLHFWHSCFLHFAFQTQQFELLRGDHLHIIQLLFLGPP